MYLRSFVTMLLLMVSWEVVSDKYPSVFILISSPTQILTYAIHNAGLLAQAFVWTAAEALVGLLIAFVICCCIVTCGLYSARLRALILGVFSTIQVIPLIVFVPFLAIMFGVGFWSKAVMAAILGMYPMVVSALRGFQSLPEAVDDILDLYGTGQQFRIGRVYWPMIGTDFFTGMRVAASLCVLGAIVAEFAGARIGLGKNIFLSTLRIEPEMMMISVLLCGLLGAWMFWIVWIIERVLKKRRLMA